MAISYSTKKCDSCGGSLVYLPEKKVWQCRYCGQEILREETYDGLFTIKNVARQCIVDTAYRRMDGANNNLTECEKIDSSYIGTLIARICYRLIAVITPGACREEKARSMFQRLRDDYQTLQARGSAPDDEEEAMYEFLAGADSASDAFALLTLVFDTLGDSGRAQYFASMIEPAKVYSKECNKDLLTFSLKQKNMELAQAIASNTANLDTHSALDIVLNKAPDIPGKAQMAKQLFEAGAYTDQDQRHLQAYLSGSDSCGTKAAIVIASCGTGATPDMEAILTHVLSQTEPEDTAAVLDAVCTGQLYDSELYELLDYALEEKADKAVLILNKVAASGQFAVLNARRLETLFADTQKSAKDRLTVWNALQQLRFDNKAVETAATHYLCEGADSPEDRRKLLQPLLSGLEMISPATLERYLLTCTLDGPQKADILSLLFSLKKMQPSFFHGMLGKYIRNSPDEPEVRREVTQTLIDAGLTLDSGDLNELICQNGVSPDKKVELLRDLEKNGSTVRADALSVYLERCCQSYNEALFAYLFEKTSSISERALSNFVLYCAKESAAKAQNAVVLAQRQTAPFGTSACQIVHLAHHISCNLMQAYLLTTTDSYETASALLQNMSSSAKLTADMQVDGSMVRIKKYVKENRAALTPLTEQLCDDKHLFSMF